MSTTTHSAYDPDERMYDADGNMRPRPTLCCRRRLLESQGRRRRQTPNPATSTKRPNARQVYTELRAIPRSEALPVPDMVLCNGMFLGDFALAHIRATRGKRKKKRAEETTL